MDIASELAKKLLQINAIQLRPQNPFTWASGMRSPIYCDNRISLSYPEVRSFIKNALAQKAKQFPHFQSIVGVATAGIPHGALLADLMNMPFAYIRSKAKGHGKENQLEGHIKEGFNTLVIEDLVSTGGSAIAAINALRDMGYGVSGLLSIFTYGLKKSTEAFKEQNIEYNSLSNFNVLLDVAKSTGMLPAKDIQLLLDWQEDPVAWSKQFEGEK